MEQMHVQIQNQFFQLASLGKKNRKWTGSKTGNEPKDDNRNFFQEEKVSTNKDV